MRGRALTEFLLRYDGGEAVRHKMDMRLLGRSLIGVDQAIHRGLWAAMHPDIPRGKKKIDVRVQVEAPRAACVEVAGALSGVMGVLPFAYDVATGLGTDYIKNLLSAVVLYHGGRKADAQVNMERMLDIIAEGQKLQYADRESERATMERVHAKTADALLEAVQSMHQQAREIVAPVGPSTETLKIGDRTLTEATVIDVAIAEAVRAGGGLEVGDMEVFAVKLDGITRHNRNARVEVPAEPGNYLAAEIRDPAFDEFPNVYTDAFGREAIIRVHARPTFRDGSLCKLHILNFIEEVKGTA